MCPARCIYVRGKDNPPDAPVSPGERYGFVYEINYLRCIHCDLCVEACPTEAITESKLFEFSFTNRADAIYTARRAAGRRRRPAPAAAVGGLDRLRRGRAALRRRWVRATAAERRRLLRGPGRLVGRARLRREAAREGPDCAPRRPRRMPRRPRSRTGRRPLMEAGRLRGLRGASCWPARSGWCSSRNPVHSALSLVATLFGIAVLFIVQEANFLAAVQVIVYAGAIVVLFLFVIMLLGVDRSDDIDTEPLVGPAARWRSIAGRRARRRPGRHRRHQHGHRAAGRAQPRSTPTCPTSSRSAGCCSPTTCSRSRSPRCCWSSRSSARCCWPGPGRATRSTRTSRCRACPATESTPTSDEVDA